MRIEPRTISAQHTVVMKATLHRDQLGAWIPSAFDHIADHLRGHGVAPSGMPFARYHVLSGHMFEVEVGFPVDTRVAGDEHVQPSSLPGGHVVVAWHIGPYDQLGETYQSVDEWLKSEGAVRIGDSWEAYLDPPTGDSRFWRTEVVQPFVLAETETDPHAGGLTPAG